MTHSGIRRVQDLSLKSVYEEVTVSLPTVPFLPSGHVWGGPVTVQRDKLRAGLKRGLRVAEGWAGIQVWL